MNVLQKPTRELCFYITDDKELNVKFDFFRVEFYDNYYTLYLQNLERDIRDLFLENVELFICDKYLTRFKIIENIQNEDYKNIILKISKDNDFSRYKDNFNAELIFSWSRGEDKFKWYELNTMRRKVYLYSCMNYFSSDPIRFVKDEIVIRCKELNTIHDFYLCFGEACLGYQGYMGCNLDALDDMLLGVNMPVGVKTKTIFVFYNFNEFKVRTQKGDFNYGDKILDIFTDRGWRYELIN